jgi:hypothetical protein
MARIWSGMLRRLGGSVGLCKKHWFLCFLICALEIRGPLGGPPRLSVSFTGASGGIPDAPGTEYKQNQKNKNIKTNTFCRERGLRGHPGGPRGCNWGRQAPTGGVCEAEAGVFGLVAATLHRLGRSVGLCKKHWFLCFLICALEIRGPLGGPPRLSVSFTGASGGIPDAPGTEYKQNRKNKNINTNTFCRELGLRGHPGGPRGCNWGRQAPTGGVCEAEAGVFGFVAATLHRLGRSVGLCKKDWFLCFWICALEIRGPSGGPPRLSVSFTGASRRPPGPNTNRIKKQKHKNQYFLQSTGPPGASRGPPGV